METLPRKIAKNIVQDVITAQNLQPGDRLPTVRDIKALFEVSTATIKKAFDLLAVDGLVDSRHGSGCYLKVLPTLLKPRRATLSVTAILPHYAKHSVISMLESGLIAAAQQHGIRLQIQGANSYAQEHEEVSRALSLQRDGLIIYPLARTIKQFRKDYLYEIDSRIPLVLLDLADPKQKHLQIKFDNYQAGYEMTRRLLEEGRKRIAFKRLKSKDKEIFYRSNDDRYQGYQRALEEVGIPCQPELCWREEFSTRNATPSMRSAVEFIERWKKQPASRRPDAVICLEDMHAATLIQEALRNGIHIHEELKVVGFDNNPKAEALARRPFPTTQPDFSYMGSLAISSLLRLIHQPTELAETYVLPAPLKWI
jgi:DNA-binding LacI/PurR family transcriptional regulator